MPTLNASAQARGRIGGLVRAATAKTPQDITSAARDARWQQYCEHVRILLPDLDEADIIRRAELLRRADMGRLSLKASEARKLKARLRADAARLREIENLDLDASGLEQCGSDGIDAA